MTFTIRLLAALLALAPLACTYEEPLPRDSGRARLERPDRRAPVIPDAPKRPSQFTIHGENRVDEYAWLRQRDNPEVLDYLAAENRYAERMMAHTDELQERLYQEIIGRIKQTDLSVPHRKGDYFYYTRTVEGQNYPILARKQGSLDAEEQVMLDLNVLAEGKEYLDIGSSDVSPDQNLLAYSADFDGSELYDVYLKNLATGETTGPILEDVAGGVEWAADNQTLFYSRRDESHRPHQVWRHTLGTEMAQDVLVYDEPDPLYFAFAAKTLDEQLILFGSFGKTNTEWRFIPADAPAAEPKVVAPRRPNIQYYVDHHPAGPADPEGDGGGTFFILTDENAPNFKLVTAPVANPAPENWTDFVPHDPEVFIDGVDVFAGHIVLSERRGGFTAARVLTLGEKGQITQERMIELPEQVATVHSETNAEFATDTYRFGYTSYLTPPSVYDYNLINGQRTLLKQQEVLGGYDPLLYETGVTWATAEDGTQVPVSFVHRKGISADGQNPLLLEGYGSYGASSDPYFSSARLSLLDRGVIVATAHVRGGGEMGREWKEQGRLDRKMNTFTDFIAAAEHMVASNLTNADSLAIEGGSAGGLLVGAVVNMRPDLFKAAVADVPFVDVVNTMLDETIPLTTFEYEEWGNPAEPAAYAYMMSYSPYDNVREQEYPDMLVLAGLNDPRVGYWEPAKWVAKLRDMKQGESLLLLKTNMDAGHGGASGRYDAFRELAFKYAFILDRLGATGG